MKQTVLQKMTFKILDSVKQAPDRPPNVNAMLKNSNFATSSSKPEQNFADDDDEDTRDMTGRIRTAAGIEVHTLKLF